MVVVASLDELPKAGYAVGLPYTGIWRELFNSDYFTNFPNQAVIGKGGSVQAGGPPMDGFAASATLTLSPTGIIMLTRQ